MIRDLFGATSRTARLQDGLDAASAQHRRLADVVATEGRRSGTGFDGALARASGGGKAVGVDMETTMAQLADTQLRYDATTRLLQKAYAQLRTAMRDRG